MSSYHCADPLDLVLGAEGPSPAMAALVELVPEWQHRGRCIGYGVDLWFPERGQSTEPAKAICAQCPVRVECLDYALAEGIKHGIWGGTSERERRTLRRERGGA